MMGSCFSPENNKKNLNNEINQESQKETKEAKEKVKKEEKEKQKEKKEEKEEKQEEKEIKPDEKGKQEEKEEKPDEKEKQVEKQEKLDEKEKQEKPDDKEKEIDFDYSLLEPLINEIKEENKDKTKIILLTTGSYNPIHRMHLEILNIAYRHLLSLNNYNVICGFISPSADCYVSSKRPPLITFDMRCKIIEKAIEEYQSQNEDNGLKIFLHKWEGSKDFFIDFPDVIRSIQSRLYKYKIKLVYVCGMDLYMKCARYLGRNIIAVDRKPYSNNIFYEEPKRLLFLIKDEKTEPYSSTSIREYYQNKQFEEIEKSTFPEVAKMIINYYDSLPPEKFKYY